MRQTPGNSVWSSSRRSCLEKTIASESRGRSRDAARRAVFLAYREGPEAQREDDESGKKPAKVLSKTVVQDAEPGEHLSKQPPAEAFRNAQLGAPPLREPTVVEAHINHLDHGVDPGEDADAAQLEDEVRRANGGGSKSMEDPDN